MVEVLTQGHCQFCDAAAERVVGTPGPGRLVVCHVCGEEYKRLMKEHMDAIPEDLDHDVEIKYLRSLPNRVHEFMMKNRGQI